MPHRYWLAAAALATLAVGCARRAPNTDPPAAPPAPAIRRTELGNGFVSMDLTLPPGRSGPFPVVISPAIDRDLLLAAGFALVDFRAHWERLAGLRPRREQAPPQRSVGKWLLASPSAATVGKGYFGLIDYDARTAVPMVIDHLATVADIDSGRIGVTGNSTRGFMALQAVARDDRIAVAAVANACGDYHAFLARSTLGLDGEQPLDLAPDYDAFLREREAIRHPERLPPAALLLVNGSRDRAVPIDCVRTTTHALRLAYEAVGLPEHFRAVVLPGHGHEVGPEVTEEVLAWLVRWLGS